MLFRQQNCYFNSNYQHFLLNSELKLPGLINAMIATNEINAAIIQ